MSKNRKIWLGVLTFLPIVLIIAYFVVFFLFFFNIFSDIQAIENAENLESNLNQFPAQFMSNFAILFILIMLSSLLSVGLLVYYIIHANNNITNDSNKKLMWTLVLIFTSGIGTIVYYFVEILPDKENKLNTKDIKNT